MTTCDLRRFMQKLIVKSDGCWAWSGSRSYLGYGRFALNGKSRAAHRVSYAYFVGPIPAGLEIDHLCRNRECVNPSHLDVVTRIENVRRAAAIRQTCRYGHPLTWVRDGSRRRCRTCDLVFHRASRQRLKAAT